MNNIDPTIINVIRQILSDRGHNEVIVNCHLSYDGYYKVEFPNDESTLVHCNAIIEKLCYIIKMLTY